VLERAGELPVVPRRASVVRRDEADVELARLDVAPLLGVEVVHDRDMCGRTGRLRIDGDGGDEVIH